MAADRDFDRRGGIDRDSGVTATMTEALTETVTSDGTVIDHEATNACGTVWVFSPPPSLPGICSGGRMREPKQGRPSDSDDGPRGAHQGGRKGVRQRVGRCVVMCIVTGGLKLLVGSMIWLGGLLLVDQ